MKPGERYAVRHGDGSIEVLQFWSCWACGQRVAGRDRACAACCAPPLERGEIGDSGIYFIGAGCGLAKIGITRRTFAKRLAQLQARSPEPLRPLGTLPGASHAVERWLHDQFGETRDRATARAYGLPHASEWFWPTPALRRLIDGREFIRDGVLWEMA